MIELDKIIKKVEHVSQERCLEIINVDEFLNVVMINFNNQIRIRCSLEKYLDCKIFKICLQYKEHTFEEDCTFINSFTDEELDHSIRKIIGNVLEIIN